MKAGRRREPALGLSQGVSTANRRSFEKEAKAEGVVVVPFARVDGEVDVSRVCSEDTVEISQLQSRLAAQSRSRQYMYGRIYICLPLLLPRTCMTMPCGPRF